MRVCLEVKFDSCNNLLSSIKYFTCKQLNILRCVKLYIKRTYSYYYYYYYSLLSVWPQLIQNSHQHSVSYTLSRSQAVIVQYDHDPDTDMFQIGRSSEDPIDFVVMDTVPGAQRGDSSVAQQSTISRFACRIIVDRNHPHTAKIYAAGFDVAKNIFLGVRFV